MSATSFGLSPSPVTPHMLTRGGHASGCRDIGLDSPAAPLLECERAGQTEDHERVDPVQDPDAVDVFADPGEHDLDGHEDGQRQVLPDARAPNPSSESDQEEHYRGDEDDVAERGVKA